MLRCSVKKVMLEIGETVEKNKEFLTELDLAIGDADHGINLTKGFRAVATKLSATETDDIGEIFTLVGMTLVGNVGGASGPLYGTAFMRAGSYAAGKTSLIADDFVGILEAAIGGIKMRGKAEAGDKTMLDALIPALNAFQEALKQGITVHGALTKAVEAALAGVNYTKEIQARKGRASYLGARSIGHQDPGATSTYLMLRTISKAVQTQGQPEK